MKTWSVIALLSLAAGLAWSQAGKAINTTCPIKGTPANGPTAMYKGKTIAFCCGNCLGQFRNDPDKIAALLPEFAPVTGPASLASLKEAADAGKAGPKPLVIYFADPKKGPKDELWLRALVEATVTPELDKCAYFKMDFDKANEDVKKYKVTAASSLVIVDARTDEHKVLKTLTAPAPKTIAKELADAFKKVTAAK
jgi:hypothetical protein